MAMDASAAANQQNLAMQQNWSQWQAYQQQLAQWQAQYGEQYQREMLQKMGYNAASNTPTGYAVAQQPPMPYAIQQPAPPPPNTHHPTPPPPMAQQPAPPPPPPEPSEQSHPYNTLPPNIQHTYIQPNGQLYHQPPSHPARNNHNAPTAQSPLVVPPSAEEIAFDEQFKKWEDEFNKWKQLNVNHPDRVAYMDYETKMEQCRTKLLERREQMRQRKLQMLAAKEAPPTHQRPQSQQHVTPQPQQPTEQQSVNANAGNSGFQAQPQHQSNESSYPSADDNDGFQPPTDHSPEQSGFPSANVSGGIPGLDLIESDGRQQENDQAETNHFNDRPAEAEKTRIDATQKSSNLEAISKGINNILGDPSFLNMLSTLNQKQKPDEMYPDDEQPQQQQMVQNDDYNRDDRDDQYQSDEYDENNDPFPDEDGDHEQPHGGQQEEFHPYDQENQAFGYRQESDDMVFDDDHQETDHYAQHENNTFYRRQGHGNRGLNNERGQYSQENSSVQHNNIQHSGNILMNDLSGNFNQGNPTNNRPNCVNYDHKKGSPNPMQQSANNAMAHRLDFGPNAMNRGQESGTNDDMHRQESVPFNRRPNSGPENHFNKPHSAANQSNSQVGRQDDPPLDPSNGAATTSFRPRQIINYDNLRNAQPIRSSVGAQKVFDYSHQSNVAFFKPRRCIEYGHSSSQNRSGPPPPPMYGGGPSFNQRPAPSGFGPPNHPMHPNNGADNVFYHNNMNNNNMGNNHWDIGGPMMMSAMYDERIPANPPNALLPFPILPGSALAPKGKRTRARKGNNNNTNNNPNLPVGPPIVTNAAQLKAIKKLARSVENPNLSRPPIVNQSGNVPALMNIDLTSPSSAPFAANAQRNETVVGRNTVRVEDILFEPGRSNRPQKIIIILRGPPGSGKSHLAKKIKDVEHNQFQASVRILSIDDYYTSDSDETDTVVAAGTTAAVYKYDASQEQTYAGYLMKSFKKTVLDALFEFIIVDATNEALDYCSELFSYGKHHGFTPYTCELLPTADTCFQRNIHQRTLNDIEQIIRSWQYIPDHYLRLDVDEFLSGAK